MIKSDVMFLRGTPNRIIDNLDIWVYVGDSSQKLLLDDSTYYIKFKNDKICIISIIPFMFSFHSVQGVRIGDNSEEIQNKFGKPNSINIIEDGLIRIYRYDKYNLNLILKQN